MVKVKHHRTCDCVVAGFRWHKDGDGIGSLLLGLYDDAGVLNHVGVCGSFTAKKRRELVEELAPLRENALDDHPWKEWADAHGAGHRRRPHAGLAVALERAEGPVVGAAAARAGVRGGVLAADERAGSATTPTSCAGAPTATPASCRYDQLEVAAPAELGDVLG